MSDESTGLQAILTLLEKWTVQFARSIYALYNSYRMEGIFHCLFTQLQPNDTLLLGNPGYTVYESCAQLLGAQATCFDYDQAGQPRLEAIDPHQARAAKLLVCCTPNNPTARVLTPTSLDKLVRFAVHYDLYVVLDRVYAEISFAEDNALEH